jgi:hypothetical protein
MNGMERYDINPDFLRKDKLEYDIFVRKSNLHSSARSSTCRKLSVILCVNQWTFNICNPWTLRVSYAPYMRKLANLKRSSGNAVQIVIFPLVSTREWGDTFGILTVELPTWFLVVGSKGISLLEGFRGQIADLMQTAAELHCSTNVVANDPELPPVSLARNPPVNPSVDTAPSETPGPSSLGHHFQQP